MEGETKKSVCIRLKCGDKECCLIVNCDSAEPTCVCTGCECVNIEYCKTEGCAEKINEWSDKSGSGTCDKKSCCKTSDS